MSITPFKKINFILFQFFILVALQGGFALEAFGGGWTSSGGGSGVVCFSTPKLAGLAESAQSMGLSFNKSLVNSITKVEPLDLYEARKEVQEQLIENWSERSGFSSDPKVRNQDEWKIVHQKIQRRIKFLSPLMGLALEALQLKINDQHWLKRERLPLIDDQYDPSENQSPSSLQTLSALVKKRDSRCRLVQIIKRVSEQPGKDSLEAVQRNSIPNEFGKFQIEYVEALFSRMSSLGQAMLYLHEQLYLMGAALGHPSSEIIRYWVREFVMLREENIFLSSQLKFVVAPEDRFTDHRSEADGFQHPKPPSWLRVRMTQSFGDYVFYYFKEWGEPIAQVNPQSSFAVFTEMLRRSRSFMETCLASPQTKNERTLCFSLMRSAVFSVSEMSDHQEFLYLAWLYYGAAPNGELNYEYIVTPDRDPEILKQSVKAQSMICRQIGIDLNDSKSKTLDAEVLDRMQKAQSYCLESKNESPLKLTD